MLANPAISAAGAVELATEVRREFFVDAVFHLLAHLDIGRDAASLYLPEYVEEMRRARQAALPAAAADRLRAQLQEHPGLKIINFLPFFCPDSNQLPAELRQLDADVVPRESWIMKRLGDDLNGVPVSVRRDFFAGFADLLELEAGRYYRAYWQRRSAALDPCSARFQELWRTEGHRLLEPLVAAHPGQSPQIRIYLVQSMTRNGRGFSSAGGLGAAVKAPADDDQIHASFLQVLHEITHRFSDPLTRMDHPMRSTSAADAQGFRIHNAFEKAAIYGDYLLLKRAASPLLRPYLEWISRPQAALPLAELESGFLHRLDCDPELRDRVERFFSALPASRPHGGC